MREGRRRKERKGEVEADVASGQGFEVREDVERSEESWFISYVLESTKCRLRVILAHQGEVADALAKNSHSHVYHHFFLLRDKWVLFVYPTVYTLASASSRNQASPFCIFPSIRLARLCNGVEKMHSDL